MNSLDIKTLIKDIHPNHLGLYLHSCGWKNDYHKQGKFKIWHRPEESYFELEIIQPLSEDFLDYYQRMYEAIKTLSDFEQRPITRTIEDIVNFDSDLVKIRVISPDVDSGSIPIDDGVMLFEKAKDLLISSSLSTFKKKRTYSGKWPSEVKKFLNNLKLGQTERGSYIVNVIAPIISFYDDEDSEEGHPETNTSITRLISNNLAKSLKATNIAIEEYEKTKNPLCFEKVISSGVNANLCDALIGISGLKRNRDIEVSINLASSEEDSQNMIKDHKFLSHHIPILDIASQYFKGNFTLQNYMVYGLVTRMDHESDDDYGIIRVNSTVYGKSKNITIQLGLEDYWKAVSAHKPKLPVACYGELRVTPKTAYLVDPSDFRVVDDADLLNEPE